MVNKVGVVLIVVDIMVMDKMIVYVFWDVKVNFVDLDWYKCLLEWLCNFDIVLLDLNDKLLIMYFFLFRGDDNNCIVVKL